ncbi:HDIG domain-containing protein [soil metagenome]
MVAKHREDARAARGCTELGPWWVDGTVPFMRDEPVVAWAADEAERLLATLGNRWMHTRAVADTALWLAGMDETVDGPVLVAAAYLHDIGYAPLLHDTGHHAYDGARYLAAQGHWRLSSLVANHSGAAHEAALVGLVAHLDAFPPEISGTADALTYCDVLTGAAGERVTLRERFADVRRRYGDSHVVTLEMERAYGELERAVDAVEARVSILRR